MTPDFDSSRDYLRRLSEAAGEYAGIPMPIQGEKLSVHPGFKFSKIFNERPLPDEDDDGEEKFNLVNSWTDHTTHRTVFVLARKNNQRCVFTTYAGKSFDFLIRTVGIADVWTIEAEEKAMSKLRQLISLRAYQQYFLTGTFIERSKRSGIGYIFRRLRPTLAISTRLNADNKEEDHILCGLCLHPIGYYENTFAGSLVPTDDIIGHLALMRADEHRFWKLANQHHPRTPNCGA